MAAEKQAEMEAIYGSSNTVDPNAGFAQAAYAQPSMSQASQQAASEAAALLSDDESSMAMDDPLDDLVEEIAGASAVAAEAPSAVSMPEEQTLDAAPAVALPSVEMPEMDGPAPAVALPKEEVAPLETLPSSAVEIPEMAAPAPTVSTASSPAPTPPPTPAPTVVDTPAPIVKPCLNSTCQRASIKRWWRALPVAWTRTSAPMVEFWS